MECFNCKTTCSNKFSLKRHMERQNCSNKKQRIEESNDIIEAGSSSSKYKRCEVCIKDIPAAKWYLHIKSLSHKEKVPTTSGDVFTILNQGFQKRIVTLVYKNKDEGNLVAEKFLEEVLSPLRKRIENSLKMHSAIKINMELFALYLHINKTDLDKSVVDLKTFQSKMTPLQSVSEFIETFKMNVNDILRKMEEFQERDSGWTLIAIDHLEININRYSPLKGSSYIPLPPKIANKKACINIQNDDEFCFKWAILSAISSVGLHSERTSSYKINIDLPIINVDGLQLNFTGLQFPLKTEDTSKFLVNNPEISVNIFGYDAESDLIIGPYYKSKEIKKTHINLLYIQNSDASKAHYVWIKSLSR